jgi:hypothetical protein
LILFRDAPGRDTTRKTIAHFAANPDLALGPDGLPRLAYVDLTSNELVYVEPSGRGWAKTVVATPAAGSPPPRLVLDAAGAPHISFHVGQDRDGTPVRYAHRPGVSWFVEDTGLIENNIALAVTDHGEPVIVAASGYELRVSRPAENGWKTEAILGNELNVGLPAAIVDAADRLHIVVGVVNDGGRYVTFENGAWRIEPFDGGWDYPSMAIDTAGRLHVVAEHFFGRLIYSWRDPATGWRTEVVDHTDDGGAHSAIALAPDGTVDILHAPRELPDFGYVERTESGWEDHVLDTGVVVGAYPVLRLDSAGRTHIVFTDETDDRVLYKTSDAEGLNWSTPEVVHMEATRYVGFDLDRSDRPHVALFSTETNAVLYASKNVTSWQFETILADRPSGVTYVRLELDAQDIPHVAFFGGGLKYATPTPEGWQVTTVNSEYDFAAGISLALDPDGNTHLCASLCLDFITPWCVVRYASNALGDWFAIAVDPAASGYGGQAIAIAPDAVHILATPFDNYSWLRHAWFTNQQWSFEQTGLWGGMPSLAVDERGNLHAATTGADLYYTWHDQHGWAQHTIDAVGDYYAENPALVVDENGLGHVAYELNRALWYGRFPLEVGR